MKGQLCRDTQHKRIAGVCSGIAEYFGLERWLVRILVVSAFFLLGGPFIFIAYVACWFILEPKQPNTQVYQEDPVSQFKISEGKGWTNSQAAQQEPSAKVAVKTKVWQAGEPPKQAVHDIAGRFRDAELRLRKMEKYVTSREFQLDREISRL